MTHLQFHYKEISLKVQKCIIISFLTVTEKVYKLFVEKYQKYVDAH